MCKDALECVSFGGELQGHYLQLGKVRGLAAGLAGADAIRGGRCHGGLATLLSPLLGSQPGDSLRAEGTSEEQMTWKQDTLLRLQVSPFCRSGMH